jgi:hypothetical protein
LRRGDEKQDVFPIRRFDPAIIGVTAPARLQALKSFGAIGCLIPDGGRQGDAHFLRFPPFRPSKTIGWRTCVRDDF